MVRRVRISALAVAVTLLGLLRVGGAAWASSPISLSLPQGTAFSILGYDCGGIKEQAYATMFDPSSGYPDGDVYLSTTCSTGGKGGGSHTFTAWGGATWDFTGAVITDSKLSSAPAVNPTLTAFDTNGNKIYNASNHAYLVLAPGYVPAPRITSVSPTIGPASGGTSVTITGTGFTGATAVDFGSASAASFAVNSDTSVSAITPLTSAGTVDVTVTTAGGPNATSSVDQFTFVAAPTITGLSPSSGPINGGNTVTITGTNFTYVTAVNFGDMPGGLTVDNDTTITAYVPGEGNPDSVSVSVTSPGGTSQPSAASRYNYVRVVPFVRVAPTSGPVGTAVTATGSWFLPGEAVNVSYKTGLLSPASVLICTATADSSGSFTCSGSLPSGSTAGALGAHKIKAKGTSSLYKATTSFTLT